MSTLSTAAPWRLEQVVQLLEPIFIKSTPTYLNNFPLIPFSILFFRTYLLISGLSFIPTAPAIASTVESVGEPWFARKR